MNIVRTSRRWFQALRTAACATLAAVVAGCNGGTVDHQALTNDAESIASIATEGKLLAHDVGKGASTGIFARVQSGELAQQASNFEDALGERPVAGGLEPKVRKASRVAGRVADHLEELHRSPSDRDVAKRVERLLSDDADAADELAG